MPVKFGRLGLGESPWEHVRNHAFEWGYEGKARGQRHKKQRHEKTGCHSPAGKTSRRAVPRLISFFTLDYSDLAAV